MGWLLVVEDDADVREGIAEALRSYGNEVRTAGDGVEAASALDGAVTMPDLVILDLLLPRVDGRDVLRAMRSLERSRNVPVVVLSGQIVDAAELAPFDVAAVLLKPVSLDILVATIERVRGSSDEAPYTL